MVRVERISIELKLGVRVPIKPSAGLDEVRVSITEGMMGRLRLEEGLNQHVSDQFGGEVGLDRLGFGIG
ncbi:uncharacterized protein A4U43_C10F15810 [Asparagus officinalis]|uniref:Uncharacterized protein n=1 Tax=Asparagus officinalis TaxID=4686 RepID=A0A5P1E7W1_ASPOF|nr:uncharacterized protein A4U43_C10F15810 [Asparagus officinalis]